MPGPGYNTFHGFDTGPPPPGFGMPQYPGFYGAPQGFGIPMPAMQQAFAPPPVMAARPVAAQSTIPGVPVMNFPHYGASYGGGYGMPGMAHPSMPSTTNHGFPGIHFRNPTGGVGLPQGYGYLFPTENTTIHCFTGCTPPWQRTIWPQDPSTHIKVMVPDNTTAKELMQNLGATNKDAKKNVLYEVTEKGNGLWAKGLTINGGDNDKCKKKISEFGWDASRTGFPGQRPVVWLYVTKD